MYISCVDLKTSILGQEVSFPVGISPTGSHRMARCDGEIATATAKLQNLMVCMVQHKYIEAVAEANGSGLNETHCIYNHHHY